MLRKTSEVSSHACNLSGISSAVHNPNSPYSPSDPRNLLNLPAGLLNIIHGQLAPVDAIHFQQLCMAGNKYLHSSVNNPTNEPGELRNYSLQDSDKPSSVKSPSAQENVKLPDDLARCYTVNFDSEPKKNKLKPLIQKLRTLTHLTTVTINCTVLKSEHILTLLETLTLLSIVDITLSNIKYHYNLGTIFFVLGRLPHLNTLTLDNYEGTILPQTLCQLTRLKSLYIKSNTLKIFPAKINQLTNLIDLSITAGNLQDLPNSPALPTTLGLLPNLQFLEIFTNTAIIPSSINKLVQLKELGLNIEFFTVPPIHALCNLRILHLLSQQLTTFPVEMCKLDSLQTLQIRSKTLTELPAEISQLTQLDILIVSGHIKKIPIEIGYLTALQTLHLYGDFERLPSSFGNLSNLVCMNIQSPCLTSLPDWIGNLRKLHIFDILLPPERFPLPVFSTLQQSLAVLGMASHTSNLREPVAKLEHLTAIRFFIKNHIHMIMHVVKPAEIDIISWLEKMQINIVHALYIECTNLTEQEIQLILSAVFFLAPTLSTLTLLNVPTDIPERFINFLSRPDRLKLDYRFAEESNLAFAAAEE